MTEYEAAKDLGIPFLGVVAEGEENPFPNGVPVVATLHHAGEFLGIE